MIKAEIITIGDEILIGQIVDTNSAYIGQKFNEIGVPIVKITSIQDNADEIEEQLTISLQRSDIVIVTGGLGPTKDDITKHTIARMFKSPLVRDNDTFEHVKAMVESRGFEFNTSNQSQADVPICATVIKNHHGSAPGMMFNQNGHLMFCLPGVPYEMENLLEDVLKIVKTSFKLNSVVHETVLSFGLPESVLSETISSWEDALPKHLHLAYLPNPKGIRLRLSAYDIESESAKNEIQKQFKLLQHIIPTNILGKFPTSLEEAVGKLLIQNSATLSMAESCTGGEISRRITSIAGCSAFFKGSVVSYANEVKLDVIGVNALELDNCGAVSEAVVRQMAIGVKQLMKTDYSIATSGIAGPDGGSEHKPVGTVWFAIAHPEGVETAKVQFGKLRIPNIERAASHALNMLRLILLNK